jgi:predicted transcriptional regulator
VRVRDVMRTPVVTIDQDATLCESIGLLSSTGVIDLPVVDSSGCLVGIVSEADIMKLLVPTYQDITEVDAALLDPTLMQDRALAVRNDSVHSIMSRKAITLAEDDQLLKAASTMLSKKIRRIPVVRDGKPVGTISRMDVLDAVMRGGL